MLLTMNMLHCNSCFKGNTELEVVEFHRNISTLPVVNVSAGSCGSTLKENRLIVFAGTTTKACSRARRFNNVGYLYGIVEKIHSSIVQYSNLDAL